MRKAAGPDFCFGLAPCRASFGIAVSGGSVRVSAGIFAVSFRDISVCNAAHFESADVAAAGVSARIPLFHGASVSPFFAAGRMDASGGRAYGFKAVPEIPSFFLFGARADLPFLAVLAQCGLADVSVRSEAESEIESDGFQRQFLLLCGGRIGFGESSVRYWGGAFYTEGAAQARTERKDAAVFARNEFFALGTGAELSFEGGRFFWAAGFHFLYLPIGFASAEFSCDVRLLFSEIRKKFDFAFDGAGRYALLLPRLSGGIRFLRRGRIFIDKTLYVPLDFGAGKPGAPPQEKDVLLSALLSGLSIGIKL